MSKSSKLSSRRIKNPKTANLSDLRSGGKLLNRLGQRRFVVVVSTTTTTAAAGNAEASTRADDLLHGAASVGLSQLQVVLRGDEVVVPS